MKKIIFLICFETLLIGQILPTIPRNVFRISLGSKVEDSQWDIKNNLFSLDGIGRRYFDYGTHSSSLRFSSNHDLYHSGTAYIDSITTIEEWMTNFNLSYGYSLPTFGAQNIDTSRVMEPSGQFSESRSKSVLKRYVHIDYGMSNEITLSMSIPIIDSYVIEQSYFNYSIGKIEGAQVLIEYHQNAKQELKTFIDSNDYSNLRRGVKDTLQNIYDVFYTNNGQFSKKWVWHSQDDPLNNLLIDEGFLPPGINKDSVSLSDLVSYYYPSKKIGDGVGDIKIGGTILLSGTPTWALNGKGDALYGQLFVTIPYGKTLTQFLDIRRKQFDEAKIGSGATRWSVGMYGSKMIDSKDLRRIYFQAQLDFSNTTTLNTPIELFSGGHSHPDSVLSLIGNTYKYDMGTGFGFNIGAEFERLKNRLRIKGDIATSIKGRDRYLSKNRSWDRWMEQYSGNSPTYNKVDLKIELWLLNSMSENRFGPFSFDICSGFKTTLAAKNIYSGWEIFAGITTYHQAW